MSLSENLRYCRMKPAFLSLKGQPPRKTADGNLEISLTGNSWHEAPNGHHHEEKPVEVLVYKAPPSPGVNGSKKIIPSPISKV